MDDTRTSAAHFKNRHIVRPDLYHYTCGHQAPGIVASGRLRSSIRLATREDLERLQQVISPTASYAAQVVWLTTLPDCHLPDRPFPGVPIWETDCDRTAFRFHVSPDAEAVPWAEVRNIWPASVVADLESAPNGRPETWWISGGEVAVDCMMAGPMDFYRSSLS